jgi:hypothetical protein
MEWKMNPTKPTPSPLDRIKSSLESLKGMPDNQYASLALFRDIVSYLDRLEQDTPCSGSAASSAASPVGAGGTSGTATPASAAGTTSASTVASSSPTPAGEGRETRRANSWKQIAMDLQADRDRWREESYTLRDRIRELEAERNHWKANHDHQVKCKQAKEARIDLIEQPLLARIAELEKQVANQIKTIDRMARMSMGIHP